MREIDEMQEAVAAKAWVDYARALHADPGTDDQHARDSIRNLAWRVLELSAAEAGAHPSDRVSDPGNAPPAKQELPGGLSLGDAQGLNSHTFILSNVSSALDTLRGDRGRELAVERELRALIVAHHAHGVMEGVGVGEQCPVCADAARQDDREEES